jgi:lipopolysaccharide transport system permease protein
MSTQIEERIDWDVEILPQNKWHEINLTAVWKYRDLVMLMVRRDFVSVYRQTVLGPIWFFVQPIITTLTFTVIFGEIAHISTDGIPSFLFYLTGITLWSYFSDCLSKTSNTFVANANVFGKVYFPRMVVPISVLISNLIKLGIQMLLFLSVWLYYIFKSSELSPHYESLWIFPILVFMMAGLGLGFGMLVSSVTTKYRDFSFLLSFGIQLMMYASPIVYPLSTVPLKYRTYILLNPVSSVIEMFKYIFLGGNGGLPWLHLMYSFSFMIVLLFISIIVFTKVEKSFMDTV